MRRRGRYVKLLALAGGIWHRFGMSNAADEKQKERAERLREALRANLRRRKVREVPAKASSPKSAD
jgi:preprotein translocase subunit SecD